MIEGRGEHTYAAFDNLLPTMRGMFYQLQQSGQPPTHAIAGRAVMVAYEGLHVGPPDPSVTMFKGLALIFDPTVPIDELWFMRHRETVGIIRRIS